MTAATKTVRDQAFEPMECSIPPELTIAEYRDRRRQSQSNEPRQGPRPQASAKRRLAGLISR
jgi:hypothetical protein